MKGSGAEFKGWENLASGYAAVWAKENTREAIVDPALSSLDYLRVLEIPTPRSTAYDGKYYGLDLPAEIPVEQQERAYTSPIWYTP